MSLKQRVLRGDCREIPSGPTLLASLWNELRREWADPDDPDVSEYDAGYVTGLAFAISRIEQPYVSRDSSIEWVIGRMRGIVDEGSE